jgi:hypothetical protein
LSEEYFTLPDRITASEFQQIIIFLDGKCDYQKALDFIKILGATKEKNRYWVIKHFNVWVYVEVKFRDALEARNIKDMAGLIDVMRSHFNRE